MTASQSQLLPEQAPAPVTVWKVAVPVGRYCTVGVTVADVPQ